MVDRLAAVVAAVDDGSEALLGYIQAPGRLHDRQHRPAEHAGVVHVQDRRVVLLRDEEHVDRCLLVQVVEREELIVLIDRLDRYLPGGYLTEDAIRLHHRILPCDRMSGHVGPPNRPDYLSTCPPVPSRAMPSEYVRSSL